MSFPVQVGLAPGQEKQVSANSRGRALGTPGYTRDGRAFRWALAGGTNLAGSVLCQTKVEAGASALTGAMELNSAVSSGAVSLVIRAGTSGLTTAIAKDEFADGFLTVHSNAAGLSGPYKIKSHTSGSSANAATFTFDDNDPVLDAMTTATQVGLRSNPYTSLIVAPTTKTGIAIGVTPRAVTAGNYFWLQVGGWAQVQADAAVAAGATFTLGATAGNIAAQASGTADVTEPILGWAPTAGQQGNDVPQWVYLTMGF